MNLGELPEDCIATIIVHTSQRVASRLACVSRAFASAVRSDMVWNMLLSSDYAMIYPEALECASKREIVEALAKGVLLSKGKERYVLLRRSSCVCRFLSAMGMGMVGSTDTRYWCWDFSQSSCFSKVAQLLAVRCLEVTGRWMCTVPPGTYSVIWRLRVANPQGGRLRYLSWRKPLSFMVTYSGDQKLEKDLDLGQVQSNNFEKWVEFEVGQIVVSGERMEAQEVDLLFSIREGDSSYWKGGLFIDCLALRPSLTEDEPIFFNEVERHPCKLRKGFLITSPP